MRKYNEFSEQEKAEAKEKFSQMTKLCGDVYRDRCKIALWLPDELSPRALKIVDRLNVAMLKIDCIISEKAPSGYVVSSLLSVLNPNYTVMSIDEVIRSKEKADNYCLLEPSLDLLVAAGEKSVGDYIRLHGEIPMGLSFRCCYRLKPKGENA